MRKGILAIAAAGSIFALTAAGAAGLGVVSSDDATFVTSNVNSTLSTNACSDAFTVHYGYATDGETLTQAGIEDTASTPGAACLAAAYAIDILAGGAHYVLDGITNETTGDAALADLSTAIPNTAMITSVTVTIG